MRLELDFALYNPYDYHMPRIAVLLLVLAAAPSFATQLSSLQVLDRNYLLLHFKDGEVTFVDNGQGPSAFLSTASDPADNVVITNGLPLDVTAAGLATNFRIKSAGDAQYGVAGLPPGAVFRKSKLNGMAQQNWSGSDYNYDYTMEHYVYLRLPAPLSQGQSYTVEIAAATRTDTVSTNFVRDIFQNRSEAVHVNLVGYTDTPGTVKAADLHHWLGSGAARDYSGFVGNKVYLYNVVACTSNEVGSVQFWRNNVGEAQGYDFMRVPVYRADFTGNHPAGTYRLVIEGVGCSQDFEIGAGIYREPLRVSTLGYFYMRVGQNTNMPGLPVPRRPLYIPRGNALAPQGVPAGFRVIKTSMHPWHAQWSTFSGGDGWDAGYSALQPFFLPGEPENTNAWGGHSDACDWDRHIGHVSSIYDILLPYIITGGTVTNDDFGIAESGNGLPDILDTARFEVDYWLRLHDADGYASGIFTVDSGANMAGQAAPTAMAAWANAVNCAMMAEAFRLSGDSTLRNYYQAEAIQAYQHASGLADQMLDLKLNAGEVTFLGRDLKFTAAAFLYTLTGDAAYESVIAAESRATTSTSSLVSINNFNQLYGTAAYLFTPRPVIYAALRGRMRSSLLAEARSAETDYAATRPSRRGTDNTTGYFHTIQNMQRSIVAHAVATDPVERQRFLDALTLEASWGLGRNPANLIQMTTACTGLSAKRSTQAAFTTGRNDGSPGVHPGHTPYYNLDDWAPAMIMGRPSWMWSKCFPSNNITTTWPRAELFFDTRFVWAHSEFTPQQTMRGKQALYTYLYALSPAAPPVVGVHALTLIASGGTISALPTRPLYADGEPVLLTANPDAGYVFTGWSGALTGTNNPATLVMDSPKTVTANFVSLPRYVLTVYNGVGSGSYYPGQTVNITATTPPAGLRFSQWLGDTAGIATPTLASTTLQMPGRPAKVRAAYEPSLATPLIIYRDTGGALTGTWTDQGTLTTVTGGAAEGTQHYRFDYRLNNWWAGFGLNFDAWGANPGSDVSGCLSLVLWLNGPTTTATTVGVRLVDKTGLESPTITVPRSTVYTAREIALSTFTSGSALDLTRIKEIILGIQGVQTGTGSLSVDNVYFTAPPALTALEAWRQTYFGTTTTNGPAANTADPDGDGQVNLVEDALGGDPTDASSVPKPRATLTATHFILSYLRARADMTYTVETSATLAPASWSSAGVTQDTTTPVGGTANATILFNTAPTGRFLRLRIGVMP